MQGIREEKGEAMAKQVAKEREILGKKQEKVLRQDMGHVREVWDMRRKERQNRNSR